MLSILRKAFSKKVLTICFTTCTATFSSFISRLELFSSGQKLKVPSLALPPPVQVQHSLEAYALQALLIAVQQEAHATSVHTATQAAQRHAQAAREAKGMVAKACEAAVNGEGEAHALVQEAVAAGAAAAAAAEQAAQLQTSSREEKYVLPFPGGMHTCFKGGMRIGLRDICCPWRPLV
eukprot:1160118-Pelagomonas_calceolata.AAC.13